MRLAHLIILFFCLAFVIETNACPPDYGSIFNFGVDLDYKDEWNEDNMKEVEPNPLINEEKLVVTICDYTIDNQYYCYDLP